MKLSKAVLDVVRGAGGAALALAVGCSSSGGEIHQEPSARLAPVSAPVVALQAPPTQPTQPTIPSLVLPPPPAVITPMPPSPLVVDAGAPVVAEQRPHRHRHRIGAAPLPPGPPDPLQQIGYVGASPACGRG